ncbi:hypothetical protein D1872_336710 [compost metagenome]
MSCPGGSSKLINKTLLLFLAIPYPMVSKRFVLPAPEGPAINNDVPLTIPFVSLSNHSIEVFTLSDISSIASYCLNIP